MLEIFKIVKENILNSFSNEKGGWSARKLTSFAITILIVSAHIKWLMTCKLSSDFGLLPEILLIDFSAVFSLLGLTTWERIKKYNDVDKKENK